MCCVRRIVFVLALCIAYASGSAIPMWEFLSRGEKMSHLFNMFVKQVSDHCDTSSMPETAFSLSSSTKYGSSLPLPDTAHHTVNTNYHYIVGPLPHHCNKVLLVYGLTNLAKMEDDSLDKMDPYQRGATDIIWESMMKGSYKTSNKGHEEGTYDKVSGSNDNHLGSQEEASSNVEDYAGPSRYVLGPMVVRVLPDGRPVPGDAGKPLPKDEDAEEYLAMRSKPVPSMAELTSSSRRRPSSQIPSSTFRIYQSMPGVPTF